MCFLWMYCLMNRDNLITSAIKYLNNQEIKIEDYICINDYIVVILKEKTCKDTRGGIGYEVCFNKTSLEPIKWHRIR
jgi:hypothetical protein